MAVTDEAERQFYLGVAGIRMWYPKQPLSGAAASVALDFSEPVSQAGRPAAEAVDRPPAAPVAPVRSSSAERSRDKLSGVRQLVADAPVNATPAPEPEQATPEPAEAPVDVIGEGTQTAAEAISLVLGIWESERYVLLSALSADASESLQNQLARNILLALGQSEATYSGIRWPVFSHPDVPGNDNAGLAKVLAPLGERWRDKAVVALGVLPDRSAAGFEAWFDRVFGPLLVDHPFSLAALGADASRKKTLWQQLQQASR